MEEKKMKNIVITGASGVLCSEFAKALADDGHNLALISRHIDTLQPLVDEITAKGGQARAYAADVTKTEDMERVHEAILNDMGKCDVLINGAGGNHPCATTKAEEFDRAGNPEDLNFFNLEKDAFSYVFDLNLWGTVLPSQVFARDMIDREGCCILNISSMAAFSPLTKTPAYCSAKAGISNFTRWLAVHFAKEGIRVNAIAPGFFLTNQNRHLLFNEDGTPAPRAGKILRGTPMDRFGEPCELLGALRFLIDENAAGFITGCVLPVDGGFAAYSGV